MRKLLGYKLKEDFINDKRIIKAACTIDGYENFGESISDGQVIYNDTSKLKQAGVMHWFEEVYEEEKKPQAGEYWFHSTGQLEFILEYVSERDTVKSLPIHTCKSKGLFSFHGVCTMDRKATKEEIEQALIKEATKIGFKKGVVIDNSGLNGVIWKQDGNPINGGGFYFELHNNKLILGQKWVFKDGQWAEILPTETLNGKTAIIDGVEYEIKIKK